MMAVNRFRKGSVRWGRFGLVLLILLAAVVSPSLISKGNTPVSPFKFPLLHLQGHLRLLVLAAGWRGQGLGRQLLSAYLEQLRALEMPGVHLSTTSLNAAACHL